MKRRIFLKKSTLASGAAVTSLSALWAPKALGYDGEVVVIDTDAPLLTITGFDWGTHWDGWVTGFTPSLGTLSVPSLGSISLGSIEISATYTGSLPGDSLGSMDLSDPLVDDYSDNLVCTVDEDDQIDYSENFTLTYSLSTLVLGSSTFSLPDGLTISGTYESSEEIWWA